MCSHYADSALAAARKTRLNDPPGERFKLREHAAGAFACADLDK
jgi:hypothetical protein